MMIKVSYLEDKDRYLRILDTCIEYYKFRLLVYRGAALAISAGLITFSMGFIIAILSTINPILVAPIAIILFLFVVITLLNSDSTSTDSTSTLSTKILNKFFRLEEYKKLVSKLDELFVAKINPIKWDLEVEINEEPRRIKDVKTIPRMP